MGINTRPPRRRGGMTMEDTHDYCHAQKFPNRIPSRMCIKIPVQERLGYTNDKVDIQIHVLQTL